MQMKRTQRILMALFLVIIALAVVLVVVFETGIAEPGAWAGNEQLEFIVVSLMELIALCVIPLGLRLLKFGGIRRQLLAQSAEKLLCWGSVRMLMLGVPFVACVLFYYLFFMKATFGYLAIILLLSMLFVLPTRGKCESETR